MSESLRTRLARWGFNLFPAYVGTGARITHIRADWRHVRVRLPLSWRTRNYVGTIFGGSMYGAVDPLYMIMLMKTLGDGYRVWVKSAEVRYRRPGRDTLHASFTLTDELLEELRAALARGEPVERVFTVELVDADGEVHATVDQVLHLRRIAGEEGRTS